MEDDVTRRYSSSDDGDDEDEPITAQKVLEIMQNTWLNERLAPDILVHQTEMLELTMGQIEHMEENLKQLNNKGDLRFITHQMELDRVRYLMASYLRCRLLKIERYTKYILNFDDACTRIDQKRLSAEEKKYAEQYEENLKLHLHQVALQHMPYNLQQQQQDDPSHILKPNLLSHVFLKANVSVVSVIVGIDEEVNLDTGSQHIMPYKFAADLIIDGRVQLI